MGALDNDFARRFARQQRAREARDRREILDAEYDQREAARSLARLSDGTCARCGQRSFHWPGCPNGVSS